MTVSGIRSVLAWIMATNAAAALFRRAPAARRATIISNMIALAGVIIGVVALAVGAGPRTATNDLYHRLMLATIGVSFLLLFVSRARVRAGT